MTQEDIVLIGKALVIAAERTVAPGIVTEDLQTVRDAAMAYRRIALEQADQRDHSFGG